MMRRHWFILFEGSWVGPYSPPQLERLLAAGKIRPIDWVRSDDYKSVSDVKTIIDRWNWHPSRIGMTMSC